MVHDDGQIREDYEEADVLLIGVSRTSKTPTSIYLANRGIKTANIPFVPNMPLPESIFGLRKPLIVGLIASAGADRPGSPEPARSLAREDGFVLCRSGRGRPRKSPSRASLCALRLAGDRCHAPLDRGDCGGDHRSLQGASRQARRLEQGSRSCMALWRGKAPLVLASKSAARPRFLPRRAFRSKIFAPRRSTNAR